MDKSFKDQVLGNDNTRLLCWTGRMEKKMGKEERKREENRKRKRAALCVNAQNMGERKRGRASKL